MIEEPRPGVVLIGTAHISPTSVAEVEATLRERRPSRVLIELDAKRFEALRDPEAWQNTDIVQVIRQKKQHLFLLQLYLASMQARMGRETGVAPGAEMLKAVEVADEIGAEVVLIDRDVAVTLKRGFGSMGLWQRLRMFWNVWMELLTPAKAQEDEAFDVDALLETDAITAMTEEFARFAPTVKTALIDERDAYMASHVDEQADVAQGAGVVAVVGAGHVPGMLRHLAANDPINRAGLDEVPTKRFSVGKALAYLVPAFIIGIFVYLGVTGRYADLQEVALHWILINGVLSALGAALAGGHILSILTALVMAPITSLNPAIAAGWFAGLTEATVRRPKVSDFQDIKQIERFRDFYSNGVVRILLVTALANLGSVAGTYIAGAKIVETLVGA